MNKVLPLSIAIRYIRGKRSIGFASFISWLSFIAMTLGVISLIVVLSVMNGFNAEIRGRILQVIPHAELKFESKQNWQVVADKLLSLNYITGAAPFVSGYGMLSYQGINNGVRLEGIAPDDERNVTSIHQSMLIGDFADLQPGEFGIILGESTARSLGVVRGDGVLLSLPEVSVTPVGIFPRFKRFTVVGIFHVGAQVDEALAFIDYRDAQKIYRRPDQVDGLRLRFADPLNAAGFAFEIKQLVSDQAEYVPWSKKMASLFDAIKTEKMVVGVMLSSIIAVAAFNIIAGLVLMVADKRKDIAVLRTLGADQNFVHKLVFTQGTLLGVMGVIVGAFIGCLLAYFVGDIVTLIEGLLGVYVFDPEVFFISRLPSEVHWQDVSLIALTGLILSIVASLYPAWRAGQIPPAEALRYDH